MPPDVAYQVIHDELMLDGNARLNVATFVSTWMEPQAERLIAECLDKNMIDKDEYPQTAEIESRCVGILSHLWRAPDGDAGDGLLDDGLERGCDARRPRAQAPLAEAARRRGQAGRRAQPRDGHQRPGLLGEVRELLGRRDAARAHGGRPLPPVGRGGREALRREHDRRRRHPRLDLRRLLRAGEGDLRRARHASERHRARRPGARRRRVGRVRGAVPRPRCRVGLPATARRLDQRVGTQVRARVPGRGLGRVARRRRAAGGPDLLGQLPRRQHADVRAQLLAPRRADRGAVLQLPPPRVRRLPEGARLRAGGGDAPRGQDRRGRPVRARDARRRAAGVRLPARRGRRQLHRLRRLERPAGARLAGARRTRSPTNRTDLDALRVVVRRGFTHDLADLLVADLERQLPRLQRQPEPVHDAGSGTGFAH